MSNLSVTIEDVNKGLTALSYVSHSSNASEIESPLKAASAVKDIMHASVLNSSEAMAFGLLGVNKDKGEKASNSLLFADQASSTGDGDGENDRRVDEQTQARKCQEDDAPVNALVDTAMSLPSSVDGLVCLKTSTTSSPSLPLCVASEPPRMGVTTSPLLLLPPPSSSSTCIPPSISQYFSPLPKKYTAGGSFVGKAEELDAFKALAEANARIEALHKQQYDNAVKNDALVLRLHCDINALETVVKGKDEVIDLLCRELQASNFIIETAGDGDMSKALQQITYLEQSKEKIIVDLENVITENENLRDELRVKSATLEKGINSTRENSNDLRPAELSDANDLRKELKFAYDELMALKQRFIERHIVKSIIGKKKATTEPTATSSPSTIEAQRLLESTKENNRILLLDNESKTSLIAKLEAELSALRVEVNVLKQSVSRGSHMIEELTATRKKLENQLYDQSERCKENTSSIVRELEVVKSQLNKERLCHEELKSFVKRDIKT